MKTIDRSVSPWLAAAFSCAGLVLGAMPAGAVQTPAELPASEAAVEPGADDASAEEPEEAAGDGPEARVPRLLADAEALAADPLAEVDELEEMSRLATALTQALEEKAKLLEKGEPTAEADARLERAASELAALSSGMAERAASAPAVAEGPAEPPARPAGGVAAAFGEVLGQAAVLLERLQEIRAASGSAADQQAAQSKPGAPEPEPTEEPAVEVSGSVSVNGQPVSGITVTEPDSGLSTTTDADGLFDLGRVPAGRLVTLTASRGGRPFGVRRVLLQPGRRIVVDFASPAPGSGAGAARLRPSIMRVGSRGRPAGTLVGQVTDARGRPAGGAAVSLQHLGVVRSDARGRYAFLDVPVGPHRVTVYLAGHRPLRQTARVASKRRVELRARLSPLPSAAPAPPALVGPLGTAEVRGVVVDDDGRPVAGARIRFVRGSAAVSVVSRDRGRYGIKRVRDGAYRVFASKAGFRTRVHTVVLRAGEARTLDLRLARQTPSMAAPPRRAVSGATRLPRP